MVFQGYNWFLIVIAVVVSVLALGVAIYVLVAYQHPEDRNQAWIPKIVVIFGFTLAIWTVLLFPLDVGNRNACAQNVSFSDCHFAIPTRQLWYACYGCIGGMVGIIIPFSIFYYEADSDLWDPPPLPGAPRGVGARLNISVLEGCTKCLKICMGYPTSFQDRMHSADGIIMHVIKCVVK